MHPGLRPEQERISLETAESLCKLCLFALLKKVSGLAVGRKATRALFFSSLVIALQTLLCLSLLLRFVLSLPCKHCFVCLCSCALSCHCPASTALSVSALALCLVIALQALLCLYLLLRFVFVLLRSIIAHLGHDSCTLRRTHSAQNTCPHAPMLSSTASRPHSGQCKGLYGEAGSAFTTSNDQSGATPHHTTPPVRALRFHVVQVGRYDDQHVVAAVSISCGARMQLRLSCTHISCRHTMFRRTTCGRVL